MSTRTFRRRNGTRTAPAHRKNGERPRPVQARLVEEPSKPLALGSQIRDLREARHQTLAQLSRMTGKSIGHLSQIERGQAEVSISTLKAISESLGVQISWFFQGYDPRVPEEHGYIVRQSNRRRLDFPGVGIEEELLSPTLTGEAQLILSTFAPGARSGKEQVARMAEQSGYLISGQLELLVGTRRFALAAGDSFRIGRGELFTARNPGKEPSVSLWVIAPPRY